MKRYPLRLFLTAALFATVATAQNPVTTNAIGAQSGSIGGGAASIDLRSHFGMDGVNTPLVRFDTVFGEFDVELLENAAPNHVTNFLRYTDAELYDNTIIHRTASFLSSAPSITQGGAFKAIEGLTPITSFGDINLEYELPNARGTIAAARTADINSASSQWFFNTEDTVSYTHLTLPTNREV